MDTYKARELILALVDEKLADSRVGLNDKDMNGLKEWAERLPESEILYVLTAGDANGFAGRKLTGQELDAVQDDVERGMGNCWGEIMEDAVHDAIRDEKLDHGQSAYTPEQRAQYERAKAAGAPYEYVQCSERYTYVMTLDHDPTDAECDRICPGNDGCLVETRYVEGRDVFDLYVYAGDDQ
jgi:hypothetical protein